MSIDLDSLEADARKCVGGIPEYPGELVLQLIGRLRTAEAQLAGSEERCRILFDVKNQWADRARAAESIMEARIFGVASRMSVEMLVINCRYLPKTNELKRFADMINEAFNHDMKVALLGPDTKLEFLSDADLARVGLVKAIPDDKKREAFEAWVKQQEYFFPPPGSGIDILEIDQLGAYRDVFVHAAWLAWQAAR